MLPFTDHVTAILPSFLSFLACYDSKARMAVRVSLMKILLDMLSDFLRFRC